MWKRAAWRYGECLLHLMSPAQARCGRCFVLLNVCGQKQTNKAKILSRGLDRCERTSRVCMSVHWVEADSMRRCSGQLLLKRVANIGRKPRP